MRAALTSDSEGLPEYQVRVEARDQGEPQRSATAIITVVVSRNKYDPVFRRGFYPESISRSFMPGRTVTTVEAGDNDGEVWRHYLAFKRYCFNEYCFDDVNCRVRTVA